MEPKFKTSFIPKQSLAREAGEAQRERAQTRGRAGGGGRNIASLLTFVLFLGALGVAGGVFIYNQSLEGGIISKQDQLHRARDAFQPELVRQMERLDTRIESSEHILDNHIAPSSLFALLSGVTLKSVRFADLSFVANGDSIEISMKGQALNFDAVALQADVFGSNRFIRQPIIADLAISDDNLVTFSVSALIEPRFLHYQRLVEEGEIEQPGSTNPNPQGGSVLPEDSLLPRS